MKKTAFLYITDNARRLSERLASNFTGAEIVRFKPGIVADLWARHDSLVFIMASGIVVRTIAPLVKDKRTDPAVVVLDEEGKFCISLVSGHLGGANELAREIARFLGGEAVITTASDVNNLPAIDIWAMENNLIIESWADLPKVSVRYVNNGALRVYSDVAFAFPEEFLRVVDPRFADVIISNRRDVYAGSPRCGITGEGCSTEACRVKEQVCLRPVNLAVGIGCNSNTSAEEIEDAVLRTLEEQNLVFASVGSIATIDLKGNEPGIRAFAEKYGLSLKTFSAEELNGVEGIERSEAAFKATGANGVAEPAALLSSGSDRLLVPKQRRGNVTVAAAMMEKRSGVRSQESGENKGRIFIVGTGPGSPEHITPAAREAIGRSDVIVGYGTYIDLVRELLHGKEVISTGMTQEVDRCNKAIELAKSGKSVAVISGGDPGVYAMAGLVFEILKSQKSEFSSQKTEEQKKSALRTPQSTLKVEVIPGISALNAAAAKLGAPLMHDFACISLSDRLTPWEMIEKRLEAAAGADFVIVLYNPRSKGRPDHVKRAREIILGRRSADTPVGIVKGAMRENESVVITDLGRMLDHDMDMQTTVIIGNSRTFAWNNLMITPRGYERKFKV